MPMDQPWEEEDKEMTFLDHIEDLRWHIIRSLLVVLVFFILAFVYKDFVFDTLIFGPKTIDFWTYQRLCDLSFYIYGNDSICLKEIGFEIMNITMSGQFTQHLMVSFITGLICAFPYILFEVWKFIRPALKQKERNYATGLVFWGSLLFVVGILFGYYFLTPISLSFLGAYRISEQVVNQITLESYIGFVTVLTFATGVVFELPMVIYFLSKIGLVSVSFLKKYRRQAFLVILILAAIVTPPDVTSQILMTFPIYGLYEISILVAKRVESNKAKELLNN